MCRLLMFLNRQEAKMSQYFIIYVFQSYQWAVLSTTATTKRLYILLLLFVKALRTSDLLTIFSRQPLENEWIFAQKIYIINIYVQIKFY